MPKPGRAPAATSPTERKTIGQLTSGIRNKQKRGEEYAKLKHKQQVSCLVSSLVNHESMLRRQSSVALRHGCGGCCISLLITSLRLRASASASGLTPYFKWRCCAA